MKGRDQNPRVSRLHGVLAVALAAAWGSTRVLGQSPAATQESLPRFVGQGVCVKCHDNDTSEKPCPVASGAPSPYEERGAPGVTVAPAPWTPDASPGSKHGRAYSALLRPEARHIAALCGAATDPPPTSRFCLGCHSTGADEGPRWHDPGFRVEDGVQCEACHGPGSLHVARHRTVGTRASPPALLNPALDVRRMDRIACKTCHRRLDSHREVLERGFRQAPEDVQYKTPVNLVAAADRLLVVCEGSSSLVALDAAGRVVAEVPVGRRPHDVDVAPDGRRAYVSNRLDGTVSVIDLASMTGTGEIAVGAEPHGLRVDPNHDALYVLDTGQNAISVVERSAGREALRLPSGSGPWSMALTEDGRRAAITSVRPDAVPFLEPPRSELTILDLAKQRVVRRIVVPEANMLQGIARIPEREEFLFTLARTKNRVPMIRLQQGWVMTHGLGVLWSDGRVDQVLLDEPNQAFPDPTDVAVSPDGRFALVISGGANEVVVIDVNLLLAFLAESSDADRRDVIPNHLGSASRFVLRRVQVGANPRGVIFSSNGKRAFVANALDDSVSVIDSSTWTVVDTWPLGGPAVITTLRQGQRLFHSADRTFGRQFSCASCHPDGHLDGLTFDIEADGLGMHPVDNRTLRGIFDTAPFKWEGTNPSLHRQCGPRLAVFFTRVAPFTPEELAALVWYESTIELPPNPYRSAEGLSPSQYRGKLVFQRTRDNGGREIPPSHRCSTCHDSPYFTNRAIVPLRNAMWFDFPVELEEFDLFNDNDYGDLGMLYYLERGAPRNRFDVPHLTNIYQGGPYLHNGAAETLEEIWTRFNPAEDHGRAVDLTRRQFNDLIAYLKAL